MPKISTHNITVYAQSSSRKFKLDVFYDTSTHKFFIKIPNEFKSKCEIFQDAINNTVDINMQILQIRKDELIAIDDTEIKCVSAFEKIMRHILNESEVRRDVIVIYFSDDRPSFSNGESLSPISLTFGVTYCTEVSTGTDNCEYYIFSKSFNSDHEMKKRVSLGYSKSKAAVIDDTPENRASIENLYNNLKILRDKLSDYTKDSDSVMKIINGNQLLLTQ